MYYNQIRFDSLKYGLESVTQESHMKWLGINTQQQTTIPFEIRTTKLLLQDEVINLDDFTELEDETVFRFEQLPSRSYEKDYDVQLDITVEMNLNQVQIARDGYTVLDFISDIGGMQGILLSGCALVLLMWNYAYLENFLVSRLYKLSSHAFPFDDFRKAKSYDQSLNPRKYNNCADFFYDKLPNCLRCCCQSRKSPQFIGIKEGQELLQRETSVITQIRQMRYFDKSIRLLLNE